MASLCVSESISHRNIDDRNRTRAVPQIRYIGFHASTGFAKYVLHPHLRPHAKPCGKVVIVEWRESHNLSGIRIKNIKRDIAVLCWAGWLRRVLLLNRDIIIKGKQNSKSIQKFFLYTVK